jgi:hypothetical protein
MDNGIERTIGLHSANNIVASVLVTSKSSALQTPELFNEKETHLAEHYRSFLIAALLCLLLFKFMCRWNFRQRLKPIAESEEAVQKPKKKYILKNRFCTIPDHTPIHLKSFDGLCFS